MTAPSTDYLAFAQTLANQARSISLTYFRQPIAVSQKSNQTPVTIADQTIESTLRQSIAEQFPSHSIIGEEYEATQKDSPYQWVIDPIDGTKNFISGIPLFTTLIALFYEGKPIVSIIDCPALNERWSASTTSPTTYINANGASVVSTQKTSSLSETILCSTDYSMFSSAENRIANPLRQSVQLIRYNGDAYLYALLASGHISMVLEADLKPYDFLPLTLIVSQAGGKISDWQGMPLSQNSSGQVLASANESLHEQALAKLTQSTIADDNP